MQLILAERIFGVVGGLAMVVCGGLVLAGKIDTNKPPSRLTLMLDRKWRYSLKDGKYVYGQSAWAYWRPPRKVAGSLFLLCGVAWILGGIFQHAA